MRIRIARWKAATLFAFVASSTGCSSLTTLHTARPVPVDQTEFAFGLGTYVFVDEGDREYLPSIEMQGRRGFGDRFDAGVKVSNFSLIQVDANYALHAGEKSALSIDPTISVLPIAGILVTYLWLPVLLDVVASEDLTFVFAVKPGHVIVEDLNDDDDFGIHGSGDLLGFGIGAKIRTSENFHLMPEIDVVFPSGDVADERIYTISLGIIF